MARENDIESLLAKARALASESRAYMDATASPLPPCRLVVEDIGTALSEANRLQKPVDIAGFDFPVTLWPVGQTPPDA